jgi:hypothetical protein
MESELVCDGCGQVASPEHIAKRLRRLEWATRYRPVHIQTVLLGAAPADKDEEFFYAPNGRLAGEARLLAEAAGLLPSDQPKERLHTAFQRTGFFAIHVLECPYESNTAKSLANLLAERLPFAMTRIRRSLRPKRVAFTSPWLDPFLDEVTAQLAGFAMITNGGKAFRLDSAGESAEALLLRRQLAAEVA